MLTLGVAAVALGILLTIARYWAASNSSDLGSMSAQWVAEYNASQH
jgi:hypothetical protein